MKNIFVLITTKEPPFPFPDGWGVDEEEGKKDYYQQVGIMLSLVCIGSIVFEQDSLACFGDQ